MGKEPKGICQKEAGCKLDNGVRGTDCLHEAQVVWNLLAVLELKLRRKETEKE